MARMRRAALTAAFLAITTVSCRKQGTQPGGQAKPSAPAKAKESFFQGQPSMAELISAATDDNNRFHGPSGKMIEAIERLGDAKGQDAGPATAALVEVTGFRTVFRTSRDEDVHDAALKSLKQLGTQESLRAVRRYKLAWAKPKDIGPEAVQDLPGLIADLDDHKAEFPIRYQAVKAIYNLGPRAEPAIPALLRFLGDPSDPYTWEAIHALVKIGPPAKAAVPTVAGWLNVKPRAEYTWLLRDLGPLAREAAPALAQTGVLKNPDRFVREGAVEALGKIGANDDATVRALIRALKDESGSVRKEAADSLREIGADAKQAIPALKKAREKETDGETESSMGDAINTIEYSFTPLYARPAH